MATGLAIPVGVGPGGGAAVVSGDDNDRKIIRTALLDDSNENAFQQNPGLGLTPIFDISDTVSKSRIMSRLVSIFQKFEAQKRYKLVQGSVNWATTALGELVLSFVYWNMESDNQRDFEMSFAKSLSTTTTTGSV